LILPARPFSIPSDIPTMSGRASVRWRHSNTRTGMGVCATGREALCAAIQRIRSLCSKTCVPASPRCA
jgi:hypothetical protein